MEISQLSVPGSVLMDLSGLLLFSFFSFLKYLLKACKLYMYINEKRRQQLTCQSIDPKHTSHRNCTREGVNVRFDFLIDVTSPPHYLITTIGTTTKS